MLFLLFFYRHQRNTYRLLIEKHQRYVEEFKKKQELEASVKLEKEQTQDNNAYEEADRELFARAETLMRDQKVYRLKSLTRDSMAEMLGTNRTYFSRAVNNVSGKSFSDWLNSWRVMEATMVMSDISQDVPLKQLADDLGCVLPFFSERDRCHCRKIYEGSEGRITYFMTKWQICRFAIINI